MLALRAVVGRRLAPFFALLLSMGGGFVAFHAAPAAAADCTATSADTDLDRVPDCWETSNGLTVGRRDAGSDKDRDGLSAKSEYAVDSAFSAGGPLANIYNAADDDSNNNGVEDGDEDLDNDGLTNENEREARTAVLNADSDSDAVLDGADDTDQDGVTNADEGNSVDEDGDILGVDDLTDDNNDGLNDANQDFDCDGVRNRNELQAASSNSDNHGVGDAADDSDQDGIENGTEVTEPADDVLDPDSNDDGVEDGDADSDNDGVQDGNDDGHVDDDSQDDGDCSVPGSDG